MPVESETSRVRVFARRLLLLAAVVSIVGCDRLTKQVATQALSGEPTKSYFFDVLRLTYAENTGSFLSLGAELPETVRFAIFVLGTGLMIVFLVVYAVRRRWSGAQRVGLAMLVAGGVSNWADRLSDGKVVDFLNVGVGPVRTGIFNVADVALMSGIVVLMAGEYWQSRTRARHARTD